MIKAKQDEIAMLEQVSVQRKRDLMLWEADRQTHRGDQPIEVFEFAVPNTK